MKKFSKYILALLLCVTSIFCCSGCFETTTPPPPPAVTNINHNYTVTASENLSLIAERSLPSVVTIFVMDSQKNGNLGSGVCIKAGGYIATNYHVIENAVCNSDAYSIIVMHNGGAEEPTHTAKVKVLWHNIETDTAIIKCPCTDCPALEMEDRTILNTETNRLKIAEDVLVIGTPQDPSLANSVTKGVVSHTNRNAISTYGSGLDNVYENMIQHDGAISGGCSGGPLIDSKGKVIGLNTLGRADIHEIKNGAIISTDSNDIYFATPILPIIKVIDKVVAADKANGEFIAGKTNVTGVDRIIDGTKKEKGYYVTSNGSKLKDGDKIIEVEYNGEKIAINQRNDFLYATMGLDKGKTITVTFMRNGIIVNPETIVLS